MFFVLIFFRCVIESSHYLDLSWLMSWSLTCGLLTLADMTHQIIARSTTFFRAAWSSTSWIKARSKDYFSLLETTTTIQMTKSTINKTYWRTSGKCGVNASSQTSTLTHSLNSISKLNLQWCLTKTLKQPDFRKNPCNSEQDLKSMHQTLCSFPALSSSKSQWMACISSLQNAGNQLKI